MNRRVVILAACLSAALLSLGALAAPSFAAAPAWQPILATAPTVLPPVQSEVQTVAVDAEGGSFTLTFQGQSTGPIAFDASPEAVESALNGLSSVGGAGGSVSVSGGPGDDLATHPYVVVFGGALANTDVAELSANAAGLTGGSNHVAVVNSRVPGGAGTTVLVLRGQNIGGFQSSGAVTYRAKLPAGVTTTATPTGQGWSCTPGAGQSEFSCTSSDSVASSVNARAIDADVTAAPGTSSGIIEAEISGGGAAPARAQLPLTISSTPAGPGIQWFSGGAYDSNGRSDQRAGAHPFTASTSFLFNTVRSVTGRPVLAGDPKDIVVDLPPGFVGNPIAIPQCPERVSEKHCPPDTLAGIVQPILQVEQAGTQDGVFNTEAPLGSPAKFRFTVSNIEPLNAIGSLRSDEDYGITVASLNTPQLEPVFGASFTFWGTPAAAAHDEQRCTLAFDENGIALKPGCDLGDAPPTAFITNAADCAEQAAAPPLTLLHLTSWQFPGQIFNSAVGIPPVQECDELHFESTFTFQPDQAKPDSPAAFTANLTVPSEGLTNPRLRATPPLKKTVVSFPQGVTVNPAAADGLEACSLAQIGYRGSGFPMPSPIRFNKEPNHCPQASKIGSGTLQTAILEDPLQGDVYLAAQGNGNPYGSLFAIYLVIEDPRHGIFIKLPGRVDVNEQTGQITTTFDDLPQLPFSSLKLNFKGGSRSAFATPETCGKFTTRTVNTPWSAPESGPDFQTEDSFDISGGCASTPSQRPFNLGMSAGSSNPLAGAHSPFSIRITRPDGAQELDSFEITPPAGFAATLKGVPNCSDAAIAAAGGKTGKEEQASSSCPAASQVGTTMVGAGAGPNPFYAPGKLYLAGPYKGAPLSVVAITPALAGPFDLGNVVVRTALFVNPETAQITAKSDPLPQYLKGVQLRIRDVRVNLDRPNWALNPTSCDASSVDLTIHGNSGATAKPTNRFQVGGCEKLDFKPSLQIRLKGGTKRNKYPALVATLTQPPGQANIGFAQVALPHSEFLEQGHIGTVCTRVQFAAHQCPAASIYGQAEALTPLLDQPLSGPVYLRSSNHKLPDLVAALRGPASQPIEIDLDGGVDSVHGGIRTTFEAVPDAPVSKFVLRMRGGKKGLLVNSTNICRGKHRASVRLIAHNNKVAKSSPKVKPQCRHRKRRRHHGHHHRKGAKHQAHAHQGGKGQRHRSLLASLRLPF